MGDGWRERAEGAERVLAVSRIAADKPPMFVDAHGFVRVNVRRWLVGRDAVLNVYDPWPIVASHALHMPMLIAQQICAGCNGWAVFDLCIVKLVCNSAPW